jgi:hypothetical protein
VSLGEAWWFAGRSVEQLPQYLLDFLPRRGIDCRNPDDGRLWVLDEVGSRREAASDFVFVEWAAERNLTMQLWLDPDTDVLVTMEPANSLIVFDLDGLLIDEAGTVVSALLLAACTRHDTRALVVDRYLPDRGEQWSRVAAGGPIPYEPDLALLAESDGQRPLRVGPDSWLR